MANRLQNSEPIVGIVTPTHDNEVTIIKTLASIKNQTYKNFKAFIVDDHSSDNTVKLVKEFIAKDPRFVLLELEKDTGAAAARNVAIHAIHQDNTITYCSFLDGDDTWHPNKLQVQINFMRKTNAKFSYGDYNIVIDGKTTKLRKCPNKMSYPRTLFGCSIGCLTVTYDTSAVGEIKVPNLEKRNDYALWCLILKRIKHGYRYPGVLANYKRSSASLSSGSKVHLIKHHYRMHRQSNHFGPMIASFFTVTNIINYAINVAFRERRPKK